MAIASGDWWELGNFGALRIYCTGDMPDYDATMPPWYQYVSQILSVTIDNSVTSIGIGAFRGCTAVTSVTIPDTVTIIKSAAFDGCTGLTGLTIPDSVLTIGDAVFRGCTVLRSITIPDSVTSIGVNAFVGCTSLSSVTIGDGVTSIGDSAFSGCPFSSITLPSGVTTIGESAFQNCANLTSLAIPSGVTTIASGLCRECAALASVTIPEGVTSIGDYAFYWCTALQNVSIPDGVMGIGEYAFYYCTALVYADIPDSLTSIGAHAFDFLTNFTDVYYDGSKSHWRAIDIGDYNDSLYAATIHYNSVTPDPATALESIAVTTPPSRTAYAVGETFDRSGMVVTAYFHDGSMDDVRDYTFHPTTALTDQDTTVTVSYEEDGITATTTVAITVTPNYNPDPSSWETTYPRTASNVMSEIAGRIGTPLDARTISVIGSDDIESTALTMSMREVAGYIAAHYGGNWTITDIGTLYLAPLAIPAQASGVISADNVENLDDYDPLEPWSGVRGIWDGDEFDASLLEPEEESRIIKRGDVIGFAGDESGRVLTVKLAFGQESGTRFWDREAQVMLNTIQGERYLPFTARNAVIDPACEMGDAVELPDGESVIVSMSGELDGLCAVDVSAPPDEAINTAYPANWL